MDTLFTQFLNTKPQADSTPFQVAAYAIWHDLGTQIQRKRLYTYLFSTLICNIKDNCTDNDLNNLAIDLVKCRPRILSCLTSFLFYLISEKYNHEYAPIRYNSSRKEFEYDLSIRHSAEIAYILSFYSNYEDCVLEHILNFPNIYHIKTYDEAKQYRESHPSVDEDYNLDILKTLQEQKVFTELVRNPKNFALKYAALLSGYKSKDSFNGNLEDLPRAYRDKLKESIRKDPIEGLSTTANDALHSYFFPYEILSIEGLSDKFDIKNKSKDSHAEIEKIISEILNEIHIQSSYANNPPSPNRLTIMFIICPQTPLQMGLISISMEEFLDEIKIFARKHAYDVYIDELICTNEIAWRTPMPYPLNSYQWETPDCCGEFDTSKMIQAIDERLQIMKDKLNPPILYLFGGKPDLNHNQAWNALQDNPVWKKAIRNAVSMIDKTNDDISFLKTFASSANQVFTDTSPESLKQGLIIPALTHDDLK